MTDASVYNTLTEIVADELSNGHPHLQMILDNGRELEAAVVDASGVGQSGPDTSRITLTVEFSAPVVVELAPFDEDEGRSDVGSIDAAQTGPNTYETARLTLTSAARTNRRPLVGEIAEVERVN